MYDVRVHTNIKQCSMKRGHCSRRYVILRCFSYVQFVHTSHDWTMLSHLRHLLVFFSTGHSQIRMVAHYYYYYRPCWSKRTDGLLSPTCTCININSNEVIVSLSIFNGCPTTLYYMVYVRSCPSTGDASVDFIYYYYNSWNGRANRTPLDGALRVQRSETTYPKPPQMYTILLLGLLFFCFVIISFV